MARAAVLGKRKAPSDSPSSSPSAPETRKRRALRSVANDENADPEADTVLVAEKENPFTTAGKTSRPAKHTVDRDRLALSQAKIDGHFKSTKQISTSLETTQLATPKTPRHRHVLPKPSTPRHRVQVAARLPPTPRTPKTPGGSSTTIYNCARQLFTRSANPGCLVGREKERAHLNGFIREGIASVSGRCLYVSGPPGTGKSAFVADVCQAFAGTDNVRMAHVNCMSIKNSQEIYAKLIGDLRQGQQDLEADAATTLKGMFFPQEREKGSVYVVTLDEIDHLLTLDVEILYTLFEWSLNKSSCLVLVGIANALDLTDRFLPRLKAKNLRPQLLPFVPYTASEIASVITTKLKSLLPADTGFIPFFNASAVELCAKKVASQTGDLRKAFDIMRRTIDAVESETKAKHQAERSLEDSPSIRPALSENINLSSPMLSVRSPPGAPCLAHLTVLTAPRATVAHLARIAASAFNNGTTQRLKTLNLQQKAALCALLAHEKRTAQARRDAIFSTPSKTARLDAAPTVRKLYEVYCSLCRREGALQTLTATEFGDVVGSLEGLGLLQEGSDGRGRSGRFMVAPRSMTTRAEERRVVGCVSEKELDGCLEGVAGDLLKGLLRGEE